MVPDTCQTAAYPMQLGSSRQARHVVVLDNAFGIDRDRIGARFSRIAHWNGVTEKLVAELARIATAGVDDVQISDDTRSFEMDGIDIRKPAVRLGMQAAPIAIEIRQRVTLAGQAIEFERTLFDVVSLTIVDDIPRPREWDRLQGTEG